MQKTENNNSEAYQINHKNAIADLLQLKIKTLLQIERH